MVLSMPTTCDLPAYHLVRGYSVVGWSTRAAVCCTSRPCYDRSLPVCRAALDASITAQRATLPTWLHGPLAIHAYAQPAPFFLCVLWYCVMCGPWEGYLHAGHLDHCTRWHHTHSSATWPGMPSWLRAGHRH